MTTSNLRKRMLASGSALQAVALLGAGVAAGTVAIAPAAAQDYTSGAISGQVTDESGAAVSGATVTVTSNDTGVSRTATSGANGNFRFSALPAGSYDVVVTADGYDSFTGSGVNILASQNAQLEIPLTQTGTAIVVTGSRIIRDFSGTTTGLNVDLEELTRTVPVGRDLTSVITLAPGTTQGDSAFGNLASIGGSSVAENAYYLNGLNLTNFDNYLGSARVPFEFYKSVEVKSGGYPAEFGRATGGIINAVSKAGSNEITAALHLNYTPDWAVSQGKNIYNNTLGGFTTNRALDESSNYSAIAELGMPIIKDRLFVYGLAELRNVESLTVSRSGGFARETVQDDPFWALKVDAIPLDGQRFELTVFDTRRTSEVTDYDYTETDGVGSIGGEISTQDAFFGGVNYVAKYTGTFTDFLTVSGAYGKMRDRFDTSISSPLPYFVNSNSDVPSFAGVPFGGLYTAQTASSVSTPYETEREFYRADVDLYFEAFGNHHIRFGFDQEDNTLSRGTVRTGGQFLNDNGYITSEGFNAGAGNAGIAYLIQEGGVVELNYFNSGGNFKSRNRAFYIQDEWEVTDRLTLNLGLRRDDFTINRADGLPLADLDENYAPRLGFTYNMWDDRSGKLYGYFGQYFLPIASNTAFRQAGSEYFFRQRYEYLGLDGNDLPILGDVITDYAPYQNDCPFILVPGGSADYCGTTGDGSVPDTTQAIAANLKATRESEYIIGYEHDLGQFKVGINYIRRTLDRTAEDSAIDAAVIAYCEAEGITGCSSTWTGYHQYVINNPGEDIIVNLLGLDGRQVTLSAEDLGYGKAVRKYDAVELTFNRPWDGKWSLGGSYTWSHSRGNSEGYVQSDFGQDDAGITQDFDQPGFVDNSYGLLPNHRRHRFKLFGGVALSERFTVGTQIQLDSPRPMSCFGYHPTDDFANGYGAASHYCGLQPAVRGEAGKTDWIFNADVSARYKIEAPTGQLVTFRMDVFNLLNQHSVTSRDEIGDSDITASDDDTGLPTAVSANPNYLYATGYQAPRSVRFGIDIEF